MALVSSFGSDGLPMEPPVTGGFARAPIVNAAGVYRVGYGVTVDRRQWDALFMRLTGAPPGMATVESANRAFEPAVRRAANRIRKLLAADTPVLTGRLRASWIIERIRAGWLQVVNRIPYAAIVESRPPGGPQKSRGAMIYQNLARMQTILEAEAAKQIALLTAGGADWAVVQAAAEDQNITAERTAEGVDWADTARTRRASAFRRALRSIGRRR